MQDEKQTLKWDGSNYYFDYEGKKLVVSGDAWAEARLDMARTFFAEKHPEMEDDALYDLFSQTVNIEGSEADRCDTLAYNELIDPTVWANDAVEVDGHGMPIDPKITWAFYAWITKGQ
jgi:hypothetical protein